MNVKTARARLMLAVLSVALSMPAQAFDCQRAVSNAERLICGDDWPQGHGQLRRLDDILNQQYRSLLAKTDNPEQLKSDQLNWLRQVRDKCASVSCLKQAYQSRIRQLAEAMGAWCGRHMPLFANGWVRIGEEGFFEEFRAEPDGEFNSWLHHRPEITGSWRAKGCFIDISNYSGSLVFNWILLDVTGSRLRVIDIDPTLPGIIRYRSVRVKLPENP